MLMYSCHFKKSGKPHPFNFPRAPAVLQVYSLLTYYTTNVDPYILTVHLHTKSSCTSHWDFQQHCDCIHNIAAHNIKSNPSKQNSATVDLIIFFVQTVKNKFKVSCSTPKQIQHSLHNTLLLFSVNNIPQAYLIFIHPLYVETTSISQFLMPQNNNSSVSNFPLMLVQAPSRHFCHG